jgi:hypothetical protein
MSAGAKPLPSRYVWLKAAGAIEAALADVSARAASGPLSLREGAAAALSKFIEAYNKPLTTVMYMAGAAMAPSINKRAQEDCDAVEKLVRGLRGVAWGLKGRRGRARRGTAGEAWLLAGTTPAGGWPRRGRQGAEAAATAAAAAGAAPGTRRPRCGRQGAEAAATTAATVAGLGEPRPAGAPADPRPPRPPLGACAGRRSCGTSRGRRRAT